MQQRRQRRGITIGLLSLGLLAGVALTASLAQAGSGPGSYYAEPAWDQKLPAATRFDVLTDWNNEAVLDRETGLVWERSPQSVLVTWGNARGLCSNKAIGARKGWRLPALPELASLVDLSPSVGATVATPCFPPQSLAPQPPGMPLCSQSSSSPSTGPIPSPTLPQGHPFLSTAAKGIAYWSASTIADNPTRAWLVDFLNGNVLGGSKTDSIKAWCVRGGMNADAY